MLKLTRNEWLRVCALTGILAAGSACTKTPSNDAPAPRAGAAETNTGNNGGLTQSTAVNPNQLPVTVQKPDGKQQRGPYSAAPASYSIAQVQQWAAAHKAKAGDGYKYIYISPEVAKSKETANTVRVAVAKAWNHLSWKPELDIPEDVSDGTGLVFAVKPEKIWGADAATSWQFIAQCTPKRNISISPAPVGDCKKFDGNQPVLAERFVYNAVNGGPYANVHKTPEDYDSFEQKYKLGPIFATSTQKEAIVCGPRITAYRLAFKDLPRGSSVPKYSSPAEALELARQGKGLIYAYTTDEFDGRDNGSINYKNSPTDRDQRSTGALNGAPGDDGTAVASEWWIQLPNGFTYFSIHGEGSQERGMAEFPFAVDPANWKQDATLTTGRSCITCHITGSQAAKTDAEFDGKNGWSSNVDLQLINTFTVKHFMDPMTILARSMSDDAGVLNDKIVSGTLEPIKKTLTLIEGTYRSGNNGSCDAFCNGKFSSERRNLCEKMPKE